MSDKPRVTWQKVDSYHRRVYLDGVQQDYTVTMTSGTFDAWRGKEIIKARLPRWQDAAKIVEDEILMGING